MENYNYEDNINTSLTENLETAAQIHTSQFNTQISSNPKDLSPE